MGGIEILTSVKEMSMELGLSLYLKMLMVLYLFNTKANSSAALQSKIGKELIESLPGLN